MNNPSHVKVTLPPQIRVKVQLPVPPVRVVEVCKSGGANPLDFTAVAAVDLSSNCYVALNEEGQLIRADGPAGVPAQGFVRAAAVPGDRCRVITGGIANGFSGLPPSAPLFLGAAGQVSAQLPEVGVHQEVGTAISATRVSIHIQVVIELA